MLPFTHTILITAVSSPRKDTAFFGGGGWKSIERPLHCCVAKATHLIRSPSLVGFQKTTQGKPTHVISPKRGCKTQARLRAGTGGEPAPSPNSSSAAAGVPPERGTRRAEHRRAAGTRVPNPSPPAPAARGDCATQGASHFPEGCPPDGCWIETGSVIKNR